MKIIQVDTGREASFEEMQKERPFIAMSIESCDQSMTHGVSVSHYQLDQRKKAREEAPCCHHGRGKKPIPQRH